MEVVEDEGTGVEGWGWWKMRAQGWRCESFTVRVALTLGELGQH